MSITMLLLQKVMKHLVNLGALTGLCFSLLSLTDVEGLKRSTRSSVFILVDNRNLTSETTTEESLGGGRAEWF